MTALHVYAIHMTSVVPLSVSHPKFVLRTIEVDLICYYHGRTHMLNVHMLSIFKTKLNSRETVIKLMNFFDTFIYIYIGVFTSVFSGQNLSGDGTSVTVNRVKIRIKLMCYHVFVLTKSVNKLSFLAESIEQVHQFIFLSSLYTLPDMVSLRNDILSTVGSVRNVLSGTEIKFLIYVK